MFFYLIAKATSKSEDLILCYHSIGPDETYYSVKTKDFCQQMEFLRKKYNIVSLEEMTNLAEGQKNLPRRSIAVTFDDGYADNYLNAYPYFKKYGIPATIFVTTGYVGRKMRLGNKYLTTLSWNEIKIMSKNKIEIGAHTISHPKLTKIDLADARKEIIGSKREIEKNIGKDAKFFSYPSADYNQSILNLVKQIGFKSAVGGFGVIQKSASSFVLNRVGVDRSINFIMFKIRLTKASNYYVKFEQILKRMFAKFRFMDRVIRVYYSLDGQYQK